MFTIRISVAVCHLSRRHALKKNFVERKINEQFFFAEQLFHLKIFLVMLFRCRFIKMRDEALRAIKGNNFVNFMRFFDPILMRNDFMSKAKGLFA